MGPALGEYERLMACPGPGDPFDRHVLACILAKGAAEPVPLTVATGLDRPTLTRLLALRFPRAGWLLHALPDEAGTGEDALEEPDLRRLLLDHADHPARPEAGWLAAMVARRALKPGHLWRELGLTSRGDLSRLLHRHFGALAAKNVKDMKWKKFFYRQLCADEGIFVCKSPVCDDCADFALCYGPEE